MVEASRCRWVFFALILAPLAPLSVSAQAHGAGRGNKDSRSEQRPVAGRQTVRPDFARAIAAGTRTSTGEPGPRYWVQHARYSIDASIDPSTSTLTGSEHITYINNSPDTLARLAIYLRQNVFKPESPKRDSAPVTDGVKLTHVAANGSTLVELYTNQGPPPSARHAGGYEVSGTVMWLTLPYPLLPHDSASLEFRWSFVPPLTPSDGREGRDDHLYLMGYWYPQVAVFDDVNGWMADPYQLEAEFYMAPADYDVRVTAPRG
ncbi:MAG TPA: hypothetical protein VK617_10880, partial [Gemmatimonadaceae bacterium]|nr:hypothetical protein [Gemmatimonadaceae bacterium]